MSQLTLHWAALHQGQVLCNAAELSQRALSQDAGEGRQELGQLQCPQASNMLGVLGSRRPL